MSAPLILSEAYLMRNAATIDGRTARFILQMAFESQPDWLLGNEELTNLLFAYARSEVPGWTPKPRDEKKV